MKLSIVTPSYRQLSWLKLCVASVADQEGVDVEHIVQDAGGDADLEPWAARQANLRLFIDPDAGMYDAINRGLRRATGEICAYLNCDEQYLPGALAKVARFFRTHPSVDVLFGDVVLISQNGEPLSYRRTILPTMRHIRAAHLNTTTCATFFRRRLLERGFFFDPAYKAIGDLVWVDTLLTNNVQMATLPEPLAVFAFTGENLGKTRLSLEESERWKSAVGASTGLSKLLTVLSHRIRKFAAGSYRRRDLAIDIFTPSSSAVRQHFVARQIGFGWPK